MAILNGVPPLGEALLVAGGGGVGSMARYVCVWYLTRLLPGFPLGTLFVNVVGCFFFGVLAGWTEDRWLRTALGAGLLGGFTTFSAFGGDTVALMQAGAWRWAALSVLSNLVLGVAAVWLGRHLATV